MESFNKIEFIKKQFDEETNSHVFLILTDNISAATSDIKEIIAHSINASEAIKKQIIDENYIELIIIRPVGKEILKDDILMLQERIKTKPILSDKKFYIIENADFLNDSAANKLLKTIEEPQNGIYGFLLAQNSSVILPTIKSRCQIETINYNAGNGYTVHTDEEMNLAETIIKIIETGELSELIASKNNDKNFKENIKNNGKTVANVIKDYYNNACGIKRKKLNKSIEQIIIKNNNKQDIATKSIYLNSILNKTIQNVNSELLIDKIVIELKEVKNDADSGNKI